MTSGPLDQLRILVPESRELDLFAGMLEKKGATTRRCPLVQILDLEDSTEAEAWIGQLLAGDFRDVIWMTGDGIHRLVGIAGKIGRRDAVLAALKRSRAITRGPKPTRALRELGLPAPWLLAPEPTSQGVLQAFAADDLAGRRLGLQLYPGDGGLPLLDGLRARGAIVFPVTPYRYASDSETAEVLQVIHELVSGQLDMVAFTSSAQLTRLLRVASDAALHDTLLHALVRMPIAAIGPVIETALRELGVRTILRPERNFHLKPLVNVIAAAWQAPRPPGKGDVQ
jgi:uroporphyrinogen-III synthase